MNPVLTILAIFAGAVALGNGLLFWKASRVTHWEKLQWRFSGNDEEAEGEAFSTLAMMGFLSPGILVVRVSARGLHFSLGSNPLGLRPFRIPWSEVRAVDRSGDGAWRLTIGEPPLSRVRLPRRILDAAERFLPASGASLKADEI